MRSLASMALALVAAAVLFVVGCSDSDNTAPTPTPQAMADARTATPTALPTESVTPSPTEVGDITRLSVPRGGTVTGKWGLVIGNRLTGGAEVWLMPGGTQPAGISPSGRYFVWGDSIFDGWTGARTKINDQPDAIVLASFAPDDSALYVQNAGGSGRVLRLDGSVMATLPDAGSGAQESGASQLNVVWSADSRGLAVTRYASPGNSRVDVVVDGRFALSVAGGQMAGWSQTGLRLAVAGNNAAIYDLADGAKVPLERSGGFPSWSPDDGYVAVDISSEGVMGLSVIDALDGREVLRAYNLAACFDIDWAGEHLLPFNGQQAVDVESGDLVPVPAGTEPPRVPYLTFEKELVSWNGSSGVYAQVPVEGIWAASFAWTRRDVDQWPPVLFLGLGGKDACIGVPPAVQIVKPPFTPDRVPTATPTPQK